MADEVLRTAAELLADLPDNTTQLIQPVNTRNMVIGLASDIGSLESGATFTVPIVSGTPVVINALIPAPDFDGRPWILDGSQAFIPDWAAIGVSVLGPLNRLLDLRAIIIAEKAGGGSDTYDFQFHAGGIPIGQTITVDFAGAQEVIGVATDVLYDHFTALPVDLRVTGVGTGDDLDISEINIRALGAIV